MLTRKVYLLCRCLSLAPTEKPTRPWSAGSLGPAVLGKSDSHRLCTLLSTRQQPVTPSFLEIPENIISCRSMALQRVDTSDAPPRKRSKPNPLVELETDGDQEGPACQSCRKRKARCSRQRPCSNCLHISTSGSGLLMCLLTMRFRCRLSVR